MKKQNGEFVGKLAPYGYIKDPKDKHKFLIDKNVSHIIRKIFDMNFCSDSVSGKYIKVRIITKNRA